MSDAWSWQTASAPAAIALLRVSATAELVDRPLPAVGFARFACLKHQDGTIIDEVVVTRLSAAVMEIACHGGPGMRAAVEAACASHGLVAGLTADISARWQELSHARSPAAIHWLLKNGDSEPPCARELLFRLPVVLITGPANAGKSTLLNAWCGHQRALVSAIPGTTRDLIAGQTIIAGWRCTVIDSAGLRLGGDELEQAGQALVATARQSADVVIYLRPPGDQGGEPGDMIVYGKADLLPDHGAVCWSSHGIPTASANTLLQRLGLVLLDRLGLPPFIEEVK